jgi:hypothetical protein
MRTMAGREMRAVLATTVMALILGCSSPSAPSGAGASAPPPSAPAASGTPTTAPSPEASPSGAASSPGDLVVVVDGVEYTCSQMFSPTGEDCPTRVQELWGRWSGGMQTYLDSDGLQKARAVLLPPMSTQQLLAFGFAACVTAEGKDGGAAKAFPDFLKFVRDGRPDADEAAVSEMYFAALQHLCRDVPLE